MIKQKKYAYYLIPKNFVDKQKHLVYFLECTLYSVTQSYEYFSSQVVFTEKLALFRGVCRGYFNVGGRGQNNMKNIVKRHGENVKIKKINIFGSGGKIYWGFGHILPPYPNLKSPLRTPAEKSSSFSKYDHRSKVFDYDCVTLYTMFTISMIWNIYHLHVMLLIVLDMGWKALAVHSKQKYSFRHFFLFLIIHSKILENKIYLRKHTRLRY